MDHQEFDQYLPKMPEPFKHFPFEPEAAVLKITGKMLALVAYQDEPCTITLKYDPAALSGS